MVLSMIVVMLQADTWPGCLGDVCTCEKNHGRECEEAAVSPYLLLATDKDLVLVSDEDGGEGEEPDPGQGGQGEQVTAGGQVGAQVGQQVQGQAEQDGEHL